MRRRFESAAEQQKKKKNYAELQTERQFVEHEKLFARFDSRWWVLFDWQCFFVCSAWDGKIVKRPHSKEKQLDSIYLHNKLNTVPFCVHSTETDVTFLLFVNVERKMRIHFFVLWDTRRRSMDSFTCYGKDAYNIHKLRSRKFTIEWMPVWKV